MSNRHRSKQSGATSVLPEDRDNRKAEHRRLRRQVNQALHVASLEEDHDGLVLELPHPTHGYIDVHDEPVSRETEKPPKRLRHWKQAFWKRRNLERHRRNLAYDALG